MSTGQIQDVLRRIVNRFGTPNTKCLQRYTLQNAIDPDDIDYNKHPYVVRWHEVIERSEYSNSLSVDCVFTSHMILSDLCKNLFLHTTLNCDILISPYVVINSPMMTSEMINDLYTYIVLKKPQIKIFEDRMIIVISEKLVVKYVDNKDESAEECNYDIILCVKGESLQLIAEKFAQFIKCTQAIACGNWDDFDDNAPSFPILCGIDFGDSTVEIYKPMPNIATFISDNVIKSVFCYSRDYLDEHFDFSDSVGPISSLKHLSTRCVTNGIDDCIAFFKNCTSLTSLRLDISVHQESANNIHNLLVYFATQTSINNLTITFNVHRVDFAIDQMIKQSLNIIFSTKTINSLNIGLNGRFGQIPFMIDKYLESIISNTSLTHLWIDGTINVRNLQKILTKCENRFILINPTIISDDEQLSSCLDELFMKNPNNCFFSHLNNYNKQNTSNTFVYNNRNTSNARVYNTTLATRCNPLYLYK